MTGPPAGPVGPETSSWAVNPRALQQQRPLVYCQSPWPGLGEKFEYFRTEHSA